MPVSKRLLTHLFLLLPGLFYAQSFDKALFFNDAGQVQIQIKDSLSGESPRVFNPSEMTDRPSYHYLYLLGDGNFIQSIYPGVKVNTGGATPLQKVLFSIERYDGGEPPNERVLIDHTESSDIEFTFPVPAILGPNVVPASKFISVQSFFNNQLAPQLDGYHVLMIKTRDIGSASNGLDAKLHILYNSEILEDGTGTGYFANLSSPESYRYFGEAPSAPVLNPQNFGFKSTLSFDIRLNEQPRTLYLAFPVKGNPDHGLGSWVLGSKTPPPHHIQFLSLLQITDTLDVRQPTRDLIQFRTDFPNIDKSFVDVSRHQVAVVNAHDPSHLILWTCACPDQASKRRLKGELMFTNDGNAPANKIRMVMPLPEGLDPATFTQVLFENPVYPGEVVAPTILTDSNLVKWDLGEMTLASFGETNPNDYVRLQFEVALKDGVSVESLPTMAAKVYFGPNYWKTESSAILLVEENTPLGKEMACTAYCQGQVPPPDVDYMLFWLLLFLALLVAFLIYFYGRLEEE